MHQPNISYFSSGVT